MTRCMGLFPVVMIATSMLCEPAFAQPIRILEHDIPHAAPFFADVDGDGKNDLLVGQYQDDPHTGSRLRLFRNIGSAKVPRFDDGTFVQAGQSDASCDEFCYTGFGPQLVDFNGDGRRDLITGSRDAQLFVFAGRDAGRFDAAVRMNYVPEEHVHSKFRYNSRLFAHDWDVDGDLDLLSARYSAVWLIRNDGDSKTPQFATPAELVRKGEDHIALTVPVVADWNNDGRDDLILGRSDGSVVWLENTADPGAEPILASPIMFVGPGVPGHISSDANGHYERPQSPTQNIRLCVADYNDDGKLDLLLGDAWLLSHRTINQSDADKKQRAAAFATYRKMNDALQSLQRVPENEASEARAIRETMIATQNLACAKAWQAAHSDPQRNGRHGAVWLIQQ